MDVSRVLHGVAAWQVAKLQMTWTTLGHVAFLMHPILAHLIISFVLLLILFPVFTSQVFIVWPWYGREWSVELITLLVPFK